MDVNDKEINEILKKAEDYRKDLSKGYQQDILNEKSNDFDEKALDEIFKAFFEK
jgi:hypothetical protein